MSFCHYAQCPSHSQKQQLLWLMCDLSGGNNKMTLIYELRELNLTLKYEHLSPDSIFSRNVAALVEVFTCRVDFL